MSVSGPKGFGSYLLIGLLADTFRWDHKRTGRTPVVEESDTAIPVVQIGLNGTHRPWPAGVCDWSLFAALRLLAPRGLDVSAFARQSLTTHRTAGHGI